MSAYSDMSPHCLQSSCEENFRAEPFFFKWEREGEVEIELLNERFRGLPSVEKQIYRLNKVSSCTQKVAHQR